MRWSTCLVLVLCQCPAAATAFACTPLEGSSLVNSRRSRRPPKVRQCAHWRPPSRHQQIFRYGIGSSRKASSSTALSATAAADAISPLLSLLSSPVGALTIFALVVLIHELGHYSAARYFGITVEEFSVGFGPRLLGFTALQNDFSLRLLPFGGYVRFPENYNGTEFTMRQREAFDALYKEREKRGEQARENESTLDALLNLATLGAWGERQQRKSAAAVQSEDQSLPWWMQLGGRTTSRTPQATTPQVVRPEDIEIDYYDDPDLLQNRPWFQRAVVLSGGVIFNLLLSFCIIFGQIGVGPGLPRPVFGPGMVVTAPPRLDAAANGILRQGDVIVAANGRDLSASSSPTALEAEKAINNFVATVRGTPEGDALELTIIRGGPSGPKPQTVSIRPKHMTARTNNNNRKESVDAAPTTPLSIGVLLGPRFVGSQLLKSDNLVDAARMAFQYLTSLINETINGLLTFFGQLLTGRSTTNDVSGPIGLIRIGSEVVATKDWTAVLLFAAAISINLGVVNALPLPALDGGQLVFIIAEALTGRQVDQRVQESLTGASLLFLLLLSAGAAFGDIGRIFGS